MLDPSSATELLTQEYHEEPPISTIRPSASERMQQPKLKTQPNYTSAVYSEKISPGEYCNCHPDEKVTYFCFDCLTPPVCSECVIHGIHKGHEVLHIKKGFPVVNDKLEEVIQKLKTCMEGLEGDKKVLLNKKDVVINQGEEAKAQIKTIMDDLIGRIEKKENELINRIDATTNESLKELDSYERVIDEKLGTLDNNVKYIQENMVSGPLATLTFYADNNKLLTQVAEQESQKNSYSSQLMNESNLNPETALRDVKEATAFAADTISKIKLGTKRGFDKKNSGEKRYINENDINEYS